MDHVPNTVHDPDSLAMVHDEAENEKVPVGAGGAVGVQLSYWYAELPVQVPLSHIRV